MHRSEIFQQKEGVRLRGGGSLIFDRAVEVAGIKESEINSQWLNIFHFKQVSNYEDEIFYTELLAKSEISVIALAVHRFHMPCWWHLGLGDWFIA